MSVRVLRRGRGLCRSLWLGFALAVLVSAPVAAARVAVVLSDDAAPYQEAYQVIQAYLHDDGHDAVRVYASALSPAALADARMVIAVGVRAAESVAAQALRQPALAVLVPRTWFLKTGRAQLGEGGRRSVSAIYLDQPAARQARLIRLAFPELKRVGVLLSADQEERAGELSEALGAEGFKLVHALLGANERLIVPLERVLTDAELLLAVPDSQIFNRSTAQSLFLTSYRYRDPVLGYSQSLTRAGALLSLHSSPAEIGRQAAEWVRTALSGGLPLRLPGPAYPAYFSVSTNEQVARSLGFTLPSEAELEKRLREGG